MILLWERHWIWFLSISAEPTGILSGTVGAVHVFDGITLTTAANPIFKLTFNPSQITNIGIAKNQLFGFSVGAASDMNGDGERWKCW